MMGLPGGNAGGMVLTPDMLQQLSQGGQGVPQIGLPQGMTLAQGIAGLPQGIGLVPSGGVGNLNLPPGVGILTPEMLNNLPAQQKQMILQQIQAMSGNKLPAGMVGMASTFAGKKDE